MSVPVLAPNNQLNIQGVHASNISSTPILTSYPTSNTSTSIGNYTFTNISNATSHLNVSSSSSGGHIMAHASSTQAPKDLFLVSRKGLFTDTKLDITDISGIKSVLQSNNLSFTDANASNFIMIENGSEPFVNLKDTNANECIIDSSFLLHKKPSDNSQSISTSTQLELRKDNEYSITTFNSLTIANADNNNAVVLSNITPSLTLTNPVDANESILSASDLTFNGVSILELTNAKKQVVSQIIVSSPAIYADSSIAPQPSPFLASYGFGGWAYKKASPQSSNAKINWYFPFPVIGGTVGDLKGLYYQIFNNCSSSDSLPFFTVYTRPTGVNDATSWFHSSMTYVCTTNSPANQTVQAYANIKALPFTPNSINIQNQLPMTPSTVNNPRGTYVDTDVILFIAFGTNSASPLNSVDFSCSKIGVITDNYSSEFLLL